MLFTTAQLNEIREIIKNHHSAFVANYLAPEAVPPDVLKKLQDMGLVSTKVGSVEDAYLLGHVVASLEDPKTIGMSLDELKAHLKKNPMPLSPIERQAVDFAQHQAAQYVQGLGNRVDIATGQLLIEADAGLRSKLKGEIQTATAGNIARRETVQKLKSDLGWATRDWARDWDRIAITEKHNAMQRGTADHYAKQYGHDVHVAKRPMPDACKHCLRLHLGPDGQPRIFKLSDLEANGSNFGRRANDWLATVGSVHPNCQCLMVRVPAGWGFDETGALVPGGELGVVYGAGEDLKASLQAEDDLIKSFKLQGHTEFQGLKIAIENKAGSYRTWKDSDGNEGKTLMQHAYGYVKGTSGLDVDEVDVFMGPNAMSTMVYIIDQQNADTGAYDEQKCMLGFSSQTDARLAYLANYDSKGPDMLLNINELDVDAFKRWLKETKPAKGHGGEMIQKSMALVIPVKESIQKADPQLTSSGKISHFLGTEFSPAGKRNPGPGTMVNYIMGSPPMPSPAVAEGYRETKVEAAAKHGVEAMKRDVKKDYVFQEPLPIVPKTFVIPANYHKGYEHEEADTKEWLEEYETRQQAKGATNYADVDAKDRKPTKKKKKTKQQEPIKKAMFIGPKGGKWADPGHTIPWKPQKPKPPKKKQTGLHAGYEVVHASDLKKPKVKADFLQAGDAVTITSVKGFKGFGKLVGYSWQGRPVVQAKSGKQFTSDWGNVQKAKKGAYRSVAEHLPGEERILKPKARQKKLIDQTLKLTITGKHEAKEYMDWLRNRGNEVFLVGGLVRDLLAGTKHNDTDEQILKAMKDVDIVTTANPGVAEKMVTEVSGEGFDFKNKNRYRDNSGWGVVQILDGSGLDVAMISSEVGEPHVKGHAVGDHDLMEDSQRRDFTCNCLLYDVHNDVILDPTGKGVVDAENRVLRLAPDPQKAKRNASLPIRFWKFRMRGYTADPTDKVTVPLMKAMLKKMSPKHVQNELLKVFSKPGLDKKAAWKSLKTAMSEDGAYDLYKTVISPHKGVVRDG